MTIAQPFSPYHNGVDLAAALGTPVYAPVGGQILWTGELRGYPGNGLSIGLQSKQDIHAFLHLCAMACEAHTTVAEGELIGWTGCSGLVHPPGPLGAHLHWSKRAIGAVFYDDPIAWLNQRS